LRFFTWLALVSLTGCYSAPPDSFETPGFNLPTWPKASATETVQTIVHDESQVESLRLQGTLIILEPESRVRLHAIMLADRIGSNAPRVRLRASKLGNSVIDLVKIGSEAWIWMGDDRQLGPRAKASLTKTPPLHFSDYKRQLVQSTPDYFVFNVSWPGQTRPAKAWVHRRTRLLHRVVYATGEEPVTLSLRYKSVDDQPRIDALRINAPGSRMITLVVETLENNPSLTDAHFEPLPESKHIKPRGKP